MIEKFIDEKADCIDCIFWYAKPNSKKFIRICCYGDYFPESNINHKTIESEEQPNWCPRRNKETT